MTETRWKTCSHCKKPKVANTNNFYKSPCGKFNLTNYCKPCQRTLAAETVKRKRQAKANGIIPQTKPMSLRKRLALQEKIEQAKRAGMIAVMILACLLVALPARADDWVPESHKPIGLLKERKILGLFKRYKWEYKCAGTKFILKTKKPLEDVPDLRTDRQKHPWCHFCNDFGPMLVWGIEKAFIHD